MYSNPNHIRTERVNLSLSRIERQFVEALAAMRGQQLSALLRELAMEQARIHAAESGLSEPTLREANA